MGMGPYRYSGVPADGYKNGIAEKGAYLVNILTGDTYRNTGTKAATVWTAASGGGSAYTHTCTGVETTLAIPFPATGTHATLYVQSGDSETGVGAPAEDTAVVLVGDGAGGEAIAGVLPTSVASVLVVEIPFFRTNPMLLSRLSAQSVETPQASVSNPTGLVNFNLRFESDATGNPLAPPSGTVVELYVR
jgi:hypothetical protein